MMARKLRNFLSMGRTACIGMVVLAFTMAVALVRLRQGIILTARRVGVLEKNMASFASKNAELDAKILRLSSSRSLHTLIAAKGLVAAGANNTVRIPKTETHLYAINRAQGRRTGGFAAKNPPGRADLTAEN